MNTFLHEINCTSGHNLSSLDMWEYMPVLSNFSFVQNRTAMVALNRVMGSIMTTIDFYFIKKKVPFISVEFTTFHTLSIYTH